jgi:hypothetical protein
MYKARLRKAIAFIRTLDYENINMVIFSPTLVSQKCKFIGCAVGHMAHKKVFEGLKLDNNTVTYKRARNMEAVEKLFGLKHHEAIYLFGPFWGSYEKGTQEPTPKNIARRIERFLVNPEQPGVAKLIRRADLMGEYHV